MVKQLSSLALLICLFSGISAHSLALQKDNDNFPEPPNCGVIKTSSSRIHGGTEVQNHEFPWMVSLIVGCGGSLINSRWILTAAHCYAGEVESYKNSLVYLAAHKCTLNIDELGEVTNRTCDSSAKKATIKMVIRHKDFVIKKDFQGDFSGVYNDIALLELNEPVTFDDKIQPICLPWKNEAIGGKIIGKDAIISGWGHTEYENIHRNLLKASVKISKTEDCKTYYSTLHFDTTQNICIRGKGNIKSDGGDSGGPSFLQLSPSEDDENKSYYAVGIASFGLLGHGLDTPFFYTNVSNYIPWIKEAILANE